MNQDQGYNKSAKWSTDSNFFKQKLFSRKLIVSSVKFNKSGCSWSNHIEV